MTEVLYHHQGRSRLNSRRDLRVAWADELMGVAMILRGMCVGSLLRRLEVSKPMNTGDVRNQTAVEMNEKQDSRHS